MEAPRKDPLCGTESREFPLAGSTSASALSQIVHGTTVGCPPGGGGGVRSELEKVGRGLGVPAAAEAGEARVV